MSGPGADDRAAWIAGMRKLLGILEANPGLPLPAVYGTGNRAIWNLFAGSPRQIAEVEKILGVPLTGAIDPENDTYYVLSGDLDGLPVAIRAWTQYVAERRVTGTRTVEDVEWVRLPAEDATDDDGGNE